MEQHLLNNLRSGQNYLPTCKDYVDLLDYAHAVKGMSYDILRKLMGLATCAEWTKFLNIS